MNFRVNFFKDFKLISHNFIQYTLTYCDPLTGQPLKEKEEKALKNKNKQTTDIVRKKVDKELKKGNMAVDTIASKAKITLLEGKHPGKKFETVPKPGI